MKHDCTLVKDLLPLYADEVCSEESRRIVAEHLTECSDCKAMLGKMNAELVITADQDMKVIQRIKKRIWIERIVIALVVVGILSSLAFAGCFTLLNTDQTMDYVEHNLAENLYVEEDENGDVWMVKKGTATEAWMLMPLLRDGDDDYDNYNKENLTGYAFTLKERRINSFFMLHMEVDSQWMEERTLLVNKYEKPQIQEIYYYDDTTHTEYLLWERTESHD